MGKKRSKVLTKKQKKQLFKTFNSIGNGNGNFICLNCGIQEKISTEVVEVFDGMDVEFDPTNAPQFRCKKCGGEMYPEYYKNEHGYEFRIRDRK